MKTHCKEKQTYKKILFYEASSGFGGSASALVHMIRHLNREKFVPIIAFKNYGGQIEKIKNAELIKLKEYRKPDKLSNLHFLFYFVRNILPETFKLYFTIKKKKVSLVHVNINVTAGIPAIIAAKISGVPCVCHIRETRKLIKRERLFAKWVDRFIILNKYAYEVYKIDIAEEKLKVIYDGLDLDEFKGLGDGALRREYNLNSAPTVGVIGRIIKGKGQKEFVLAAKIALEIKPKIKFIIIGDAKSDSSLYYNEVKDLVKKEKLTDSIIFTGWRNDITNIIRDLDIVVLPSTTYPEGLPNAIIEAMALKKPVVASNIPGPSDIVVDGETGFLTPTGDTKIMAEKIIYILNNQEISRKMGEKGKIRTEELFEIGRAHV